MGLSGFLYLAIVVGWAVYLVPFALKRYDEAARNRSIDRFSSAMRVLGRRTSAPTEPETAASAAASEARRPEDRTRPGASRATSSPTPLADVRRAARTAARRRRRILLALLLATTGTAVAAANALVPWWSVAVPAVLTLGWLVLCRVQARRAYGRRPVVAADAPPVPADEPAVGNDQAVRYAEAGDALGAGAAAPAADHASPPQPAGDDEPTIELRRDDLDAAAPSAGSGSLWDPIPVTLPTYVHKPRAPRTIRTIDLGTVDVPVSPRPRTDDGRPADDEPARAAGADSAQDAGHHDLPSRRAVGE